MVWQPCWRNILNEYIDSYTNLQFTLLCSDWIQQWSLTPGTDDGPVCTRQVTMLSQHFSYKDYPFVPYNDNKLNHLITRFLVNSTDLNVYTVLFPRTHCKLYEGTATSNIKKLISSYWLSLWGLGFENFFSCDSQAKLSIAMRQGAFNK